MAGAGVDMSVSSGRAFRRVAWLGMAMLGASLAHAAGSAATGVRPSDCRPRDADSTCAAAVAGVADPLPQHPDTELYDGPLGGVPPAGYAYWGWDFVADATGHPSPVRPDLFINRSNVPVTITLSFTFPTNHPCGRACLPGVQFQVDAGWFKLDPPFVINGNIASVTEVFVPGRGYGWVIGLWRATNPRLKVTVPRGSTATLEQVGLAALPNMAQLIPAVTTMCDCPDGTQATCSDGTRYSNGKLGPWTQSNEFYQRLEAFNNCQAQR
jgi:hypothetical protein